MLNRKFRLYITPEQRRQFMRVFKQEFNNREFLTFLKKFRGSMIFRGKNSLSYKLFDAIMIRFKKAFRYSKKSKKKSKKRRRIDLHAAFRKAISNLIPILGISNVKRGRKVEAVPVLLKLRKRIVLINK
jgi:ribosomal protein S7